MKRYAQMERRCLADLLDQLGPDAPTLCEGWTTRDLAAHLVVRERRPDAAAGLVLPQLRAYGERVRRHRAGLNYLRLVDQVRQPPWWSPISNPLTDAIVNGLEMFVHHEDVRRAQPDWQPRDLPAAYQLAIWDRVGGVGRFALRNFSASVLLEAPGWGQHRAGRGGAQRIRVVGAPAELLMFLSGRQRATQTALHGPTDQVEQIKRAKLGF